MSSSAFALFFGIICGQALAQSTATFLASSSECAAQSLVEQHAGLKCASNASPRLRPTESKWKRDIEDPSDLDLPESPVITSESTTSVTGTITTPVQPTSMPNTISISQTFSDHTTTSIDIVFDTSAILVTATGTLAYHTEITAGPESGSSVTKLGGTASSTSTKGEAAISGRFPELGALGWVGVGFGAMAVIFAEF